MQPGLELDLLIAEKVMGLEVVHTRTGSRPPRDLYTIGSPEYYDIQGDMQLQNGVPDYSTSISAAWEVVEKLKEIGDLNLMITVGNETCAVTIGAFTELQTVTFSDANENKVPHAICLAALKAIGVDI